MVKVEVKLPFEESASRLELFIRLILSFIALIVMGILTAISVYICYPLQFLVVLILGKRIEILNTIIAAYVKYTTAWLPYILNLTDERPDFVPKF